MKEKEATGNDKLISRVQELEDELKDSEQKRMDDNMALQNNLKATREEKDRFCQEVASLKERLLAVLSSQVRKWWA